MARATVGPGSVVRWPTCKGLHCVKILFTNFFIFALFRFIHIHHGCTAIVVELGQDALGEGPPEVTEPDELGLVAIKGGIQLFKM